MIENTDFEELVDQYCRQKNIGQSMNGLIQIINVIGYDVLDEFIEDNPGAVGAIFSFLNEVGDSVPEWKQSLISNMNTHYFDNADDCVKANKHLTFCDVDGYCNYCGEQ